MLLSISSGLIVGLIYVGLFWTWRHFQNYVSDGLKVLFIFIGFVLRILAVVASLGVLVSILSLDIIYVVAGFLTAHTLWLISLFVKQFFFSRGSAAIN